MGTTASSRVVVLVEGHSDAVALRVLGERRGLQFDGGPIELRDLGGITNLGRALSGVPVDVPVAGLYDAPERRFVVRALRGRGFTVGDDDDPARWGFQMCDRDLEDELVRALGATRVEDVLEDLGELSRFRAFQRQPQWRGREVGDQLRRFAGTHSGRKALLAERLTAALEPGCEPAPLSRLVDALHAHGTPGAPLPPG